MIKRNTIQRSIVLDTVRQLHSHATADEVYTEIHKTCPSISRATVYRNLQTLSELGEISRCEIPGSADRYDHVTEKHYHAKCTKCGKLFDVDMEYLEDLCSLVKNDEGFTFIGYDIIFKGICKSCSQTEASQ